MISTEPVRAKLTATQIQERFNASYIGPAYRGFRIVGSGSRFIVDHFGQRVNLADYLYIGEVCDGFRVASFYDGRGNMRWTYLTYDGRPAFNGKTFDTAQDFRHGLARVEVKRNPQEFTGHFYYINTKGHDPFIGFEQVDDFHEGLAVARRRDGRYVFITMLGSPLVHGKTFDLAWPFHNGLAQVMIKGEKMLVNHTGHLLN